MEFDESDNAIILMPWINEILLEPKQDVLLKTKNLLH